MQPIILAVLGASGESTTWESQEKSSTWWLGKNARVVSIASVESGQMEFGRGHSEFEAVRSSGPLVSSTSHSQCPGRVSGAGSHTDGYGEVSGIYRGCVGVAERFSEMIGYCFQAGLHM